MLEALLPSSQEMQESISVLKDIRTAALSGTNPNPGGTTPIYGIEYNKTTDTFTRLESNINMTAGTDFNSIQPWAGMRRCVVDDAKNILAFHGEPGYVEDGSTGQVMLEIPKFYYGTEILTDGYRKYVSFSPKPFFTLHPAFIRNGVEISNLFISAYEGSIFDTSANTYLLNDEQVANFTATTGDKLSSIAGAKPCSGSSQILHIVNARTIANNRGVNWELQDFLTTCAIQLLFTIEHASYDTQTEVGLGVVNKPEGTTSNESEITGATSSLGNSTGMAPGTNGLVSISYRGIENFWGNMWKFIDGLNIRNHEPFYADHAFESDKFTGNYQSMGSTLAGTHGYASDILLTPQADFGYLPTHVGGSSNSFLHDWYVETLGDTPVWLGGYWSYSLKAGGFHWVTMHTSSYRGKACGARLFCYK